MRTDQLRAQDALDAIAQVERYVARGRTAFDEDELIRVWFLYHLVIIGEALRVMSEEFQAAHPEIEWRGWTGQRNVVVHQYFRVHPERIWDTVANALPVLKGQLLKIVASPQS